jgi:leader peptidase (prepilin peptidase)/N-methyltransferase
MLTLLSSSPLALVLVILALGLLVGSFLNVVGYRLPIMMERRWLSDCRELTADTSATDNAPDEPAFNLMVPRSACPVCQHQITALENIPLISYLMLQGKCKGCGTHISLQYPAVELLTGLASAFAAWHFGFSWQLLAALFFTWSLIALTIIDIKKQLLPDSITLPLLWFGILINLNGTFTDLYSSVVGAMVGYLSLWSVYQLFKLLTGKEGMGYGDFKLLAALGAWLGWQFLPVIIILSSLVGAATGVAMILSKRQSQGQPIPFGPFLAAAGWLAMFWGQRLNTMYLDLSGMNPALQ